MRRRLALAVVAALAVGADSAAAIPNGTTLLVDRPSGFGALPFDGVSWSQSFNGPRALSADGCFAVFTSTNDVLFSGDDDSVWNVYRLDRCGPGHPLALVSATATGAPGNGTSYAPTISADGRYVAFSSDAENLHPDMPPTGQSTLVKDMQDRSVELASRADGATGAVPRVAYNPVIAGNGRAVAFNVTGALHAANADGIEGGVDAYVRMLDTGHTYMASVTSTGARGGTDGNEHAVPSHDGTAVALVTREVLSPTDTDSASDPDAYLVRGFGGSITVQLASFTAGNTSGAQFASRVALSSDGLHVAYAASQVWETTCNPTCTQANQPDFPQSGGGSFQITSLAFPQTVSGSTPVAPTRVFWSTDRPLLPEDTNTTDDVYARRIDYTPGSLTLLSPGIGASATDDAAVNVFDSSSLGLPGTDGWNLQAFVRAGSQTTPLAQPESLPVRRNVMGSANVDSQHAFSGDGTRVAFTSQASSLGAPVVDGQPSWQGFVRDVVSGATTPVTFASDGTPANAGVTGLTIDAAGEQVAFLSGATNLVDGVAAGSTHIYVRDLRTGVTRLVDRAPAGTPLAQGVRTARISPDGRTVALVSYSGEIPGAPGGEDHAFLLDLATGAYTGVDRTAAGTLGDKGVDSVDVSANGRRVAFTSRSTNLGGGTTGTNRDAYVKDLDTGELAWVSVPQDGTTNHSAANEVTLSANGRVAAFSQSSPGFGYGVPDALTHVFVRDLDKATTTFASSALPAGDYQTTVSLSGDGSRVAFVNTGPGFTNRVHVRDLPDGPTQDATPNAKLSAFGAALSANGDCVALAALAGDLVTPSVSPDYQHIFLRAIGDGCLAGPATAPPGGPSSAAARDTTRPVISKLSLSNRRFALAKGKTAASARKAPAAKRGTTFRFTLSEPARTVITIARKSPGRRSGSAA